MAVTSILAGRLPANTPSFSAPFIGGDYLFCVAPERPDWSVTGDFIEIDCALLAEVLPGIDRQVLMPPGFISTREPLFLPPQFVETPLRLMLSVSFPVEIEIFVVSQSTDVPDINFVEIFDGIVGAIQMNSAYVPRVPP